MNGETVDEEVNTIRRPTKRRDIIIGASHHFFVTLKKSNNSRSKLLFMFNRNLLGLNNFFFRLILINHERTFHYPKCHQDYLPFLLEICQLLNNQSQFPSCIYKHPADCTRLVPPLY